jgi:hypothetical protein
MITVGMPCYEDFHGCYFTLQSLYLHHAGRFDEVVVVDSAPGTSNHSRDVKATCAKLGAKYVHAPGLGTAAAKNRVFEEASEPFVLCMDCHVLLVPGFFDALYPFVKPQYEGHLIQGPLHWEGNTGVAATHYSDVWSGEMWGQWACAWEHHDGRMFAWRDGKDGPSFYWLPDYAPLDPARDLPEVGRVAGQPLHTALENAGYKRCTPKTAPFEIPAMGMGVFGCWKAKWPGFPAQFRGFGAEEHVIHERIRRAGGRNWCVPGMGWVHRFGRPDGVPYPLSVYDKVYNYVTAFREFGWDLAPIREHFAGRLTPEQWARLEAGEYPTPEPTSLPAVQADMPKFVKAAGGCGKGVGLTLEEWYERAASEPSDINEHVPTLRELAEGCDTVVEFGTRAGVSTVGLLMGRPKHLVSVDRKATSEVARLSAACPEGTRFEFVTGDSREVRGLPEKIDLLFIDTVHTAEHVWAELQNAGLGADRIAFHDTEIYGENGEGGKPGLLPAIRRWVKEHPEYAVVRSDRNNHGFMVLSRRPEDQKRLPPAWKQGWNFAKAMAKDVAGGMARVPLEVAESRLEVCQLCPSRTSTRCAECGCFLDVRPDGGPGKAFLASEECPLKKWGKHEPSPAPARG